MLGLLVLAVVMQKIVNKRIAGVMIGAMRITTAVQIF